MSRRTHFRHDRRCGAAGVRKTLVVALLLPLLLSGCSDLLRWRPTPSQGKPHYSYVYPSSGSDKAQSNDTYTTVQPGDTLYSIAFRNNLDYHDLAAWNNIGSDYTIYPGQRLRLRPPAGGSHPVRIASRAAATSPAAPRPNPATATAKTTASAESSGSSAFNGHWRWPVKGKVVHGFAPDHGSKGIDIAGQLGQTIVAAAAGKVVYSGNALKGYGKLIIIKHSGRYLSAYGYNSRMLVNEGQWVRAGQPIAEMGQGPEQHDELHFEIRDRGRPVDPLKFLPQR